MSKFLRNIFEVEIQGCVCTQMWLMKKRGGGDGFGVTHQRVMGYAALYSHYVSTGCAPGHIGKSS
jgi:hypothetical protein